MVSKKHADAHQWGTVRLEPACIGCFDLQPNALTIWAMPPFDADGIIFILL